jgi:hypothetical protein
MEQNFLFLLILCGMTGTGSGMKSWKWKSAGFVAKVAKNFSFVAVIKKKPKITWNQTDRLLATNLTTHVVNGSAKSRPIVGGSISMTFSSKFMNFVPPPF